MGIQTRVAAPVTAYDADIAAVVAAVAALNTTTMKKTCDVQHMLGKLGASATDAQIASALATWPFWSSQVASAQEADVAAARTLLGGL